MKEQYHNTLVDLVFNNGDVLSIAGSEKLPHSIDFVTKVRIVIVINLRLLRLLAFFPSIENNQIVKSLMNYMSSIWMI